jgi:predicted transposase/invertase (TIGR01784 family)
VTNREEILQVIKDFSLMDDEFFNACFDKNIECTELLLHIILGRTDLKVEQVSAQESLKALRHRSVRLDAYAVDTQGRRYNIEIQQLDKGAHPRRARYHSSLIDSDISYPGEEFEDLPDTYVIFITKNDYHRRDLPIYTYERSCKEDSCPLDDGTHIIYVNGTYRGDDALGRLLADLHETEAQKIYYAALQKPVHYFKETPKGVEHMCAAVERLTNAALDKGRKEGRVEGRVEGRLEERIANARNLLKLGKNSLEDIAAVFGLTVEEVQILAKEIEE